MRWTVFALLAGLAVLATPAQAGHFCGPHGTLLDVSGQVYVLYEVLEGHYLYDAQVFVESNGKPGLQWTWRTVLGVLDEPPACQVEFPDPDTRIV